MAIPKTKMREAIFQILFCLDAGHAQESEIVELVMGELKVTKKSAMKAYEVAYAVYEKLDEIDTAIASIAKSYSIERIQSVERNILRLGVYEILYEKDIPPLVSIAEAIRLSNKFSTKDACKFINALLDAVLKKQKGEKVNVADTKDAVLGLEKETGEQGGV